MPFFPRKKCLLLQCYIVHLAKLLIKTLFFLFICRFFSIVNYKYATYYQPPFEVVDKKKKGKTYVDFLFRLHTYFMHFFSGISGQGCDI